MYLKGRAADEAVKSTQPSKRVMPVAESVTPWGMRFSTAVQLITGLLLPTMMVACLSSPSNSCVHTCSCVWSSSAEIGCRRCGSCSTRECKSLLSFKCNAKVNVLQTQRNHAPARGLGKEGREGGWTHTARASATR